MGQFLRRNVNCVRSPIQQLLSHVVQMVLHKDCLAGQNIDDPV